MRGDADDADVDHDFLQGHICEILQLCPMMKINDEDIIEMMMIEDNTPNNWMQAQMIIMMIKCKQLYDIMISYHDDDDDDDEDNIKQLHAQARLHGSFEGAVPRWQQDGEQVTKIL